MMSKKFDVLIFLCIVASVFSSNAVLGQSKYYTYQNDFGELKRCGLTIENNVLLN